MPDTYANEKYKGHTDYERICIRIKAYTTK